MLFGEVDSRGFFNAPVLSGWWQAASLSLALCLWSDWYEKNYRSAMGVAPPALTHMTCTASPLQSAGLPPPADSDGEEGLVREAGEWWRGITTLPLRTDLPPASITARFLFTSSFHLCSSIHLSYHPALRNDVLVIMRWKWEVDALSLCQITIIIIIIKMIYYHYRIFKQHLVPVFEFDWARGVKKVT